MNELQKRFASVVVLMCPPAIRTSQEDIKGAGVVFPTPNKEWDYQFDGAMKIGKLLQRPPREVAQEIINRVKPEELGFSATISGPGFVQLKNKV